MPTLRNMVVDPECNNINGQLRLKARNPACQIVLKNVFFFCQISIRSAHTHTLFEPFVPNRMYLLLDLNLA